MQLSKFINQIIPITLFNKGKASQLFSRVQEGKPLIVLKNNCPIAVIISPDEYKIIEEHRKSQKGDV